MRKTGAELLTGDLKDDASTRPELESRIKALKDNIEKNSKA